jgi:hypothetical protein
MFRRLYVSRVHARFTFFSLLLIFIAELVLPSSFESLDL